MEMSQQEIYENKATGSFEEQNVVCTETPQGNISDAKTTVTTANQGTEKDGPKNYSHTSTKSSEENYEHDVKMHQPIITINRRGWVSRVVPNQFDICIVNPTMNEEEIEKQDKDKYTVPEPEHVNLMEDF